MNNPRWIKVSNDLPEHPDQRNGWLMWGGSWIPTYWMTLPEPPREPRPEISEDEMFEYLGEIAEQGGVGRVPRMSNQND